eukprot:101390-Prymnesium_polylepis.1
MKGFGGRLPGWSWVSDDGLRLQIRAQASDSGSDSGLGAAFGRVCVARVGAGTSSCSTIDRTASSSTASSFICSATSTCPPRTGGACLVGCKTGCRVGELSEVALAMGSGEGERRCRHPPPRAPVGRAAVVSPASAVALALASGNGA